MTFGKALFARFGLFARKAVGPDQFDLRLQRIGRRERDQKLPPAFFRNLQSLQEA